MRFNLNARWAVETEENQVTISRRQTVQEGDNKGKEYLSPSYYYNNMGQALDGLVDRDINGLEKIEFVVGRIESLKSEIKVMLKFAPVASSGIVGDTQNEKPTRSKAQEKPMGRKKGKKQSLSD